MYFWWVLAIWNHSETGLLEAVLALSRSLSLSFPPYDVPWKLARSEVKEPPLVSYESGCTALYYVLFLKMFFDFTNL